MEFKNVIHKKAKIPNSVKVSTFREQLTKSIELLKKTPHEEMCQDLLTKFRDSEFKDHPIFQIIEEHARIIANATDPVKIAFTLKEKPVSLTIGEIQKNDELLQLCREYYHRMKHYYLLIELNTFNHN